MVPTMLHLKILLLPLLLLPCCLSCTCRPKALCQPQFKNLGAAAATSCTLPGISCSYLPSFIYPQEMALVSAVGISCPPITLGGGFQPPSPTAQPPWPRQDSASLLSAHGQFLVNSFITQGEAGWHIMGRTRSPALFPRTSSLSREAAAYVRTSHPAELGPDGIGSRSGGP